jgi:hypothetical protein
MESFILLFLILSSHLNQFEITNEIMSTMYGFILNFTPPLLILISFIF